MPGTGELSLHGGIYYYSNIYNQDLTQGDGSKNMETGRAAGRE